MVIALTNEARGLVDKFVAETGAKHPIVIESSDSASTFGIAGFPTSYLIGADGKVISEGMAGPQQIEEALTKVSLAPKLPEKLAPAQKLLDARKLGEARKLLEKAAADEKAPEEDRKAASDAVAWIDGESKRLLDGAASDASKGDPVEAAAAYEKLAEQFKGLPAADEAAKGLKDLLADPAKKKEIDAARKLEDLRERISDLKPKKAIPLVKGFVSSNKGTKAGDAAQKILDRLLVEESK